MEDNDYKTKKGEEEQSRAAASETKECILIVDDDQVLVQLGQKLLEKLGYRVTGCTNCSEALETVRENPKKFDLVITDYSMPRMNGLELARELTRLYPDLPIILYSAFGNIVSPEQQKALGIKDYLLKPVRVEEMHLAIRRVLDARMLRIV